MTSLGQDPSMEFAVPIHTEPQPGFVIPKTKPELASAVITVVSSVTVQFAPASSAMQEISFQKETEDSKAVAMPQTLTQCGAGTAVGTCELSHT